MMRVLWTVRWAALLAWLLVGSASAQEAATKRVDAHVTAANGANIYLDVGNDAGLEPGDRGRALPAGGALVDVVVRSVSRQTARCEILSGAATLDVGTPVELTVPASRGAAAQGGPEHPPWTQPTENWKSDLPLLAPAQGLTPAQREWKLTGRWYTALDATFDHAGDAQTYTLARTGLEMAIDNATGRGDSVLFDGELYRRANDDSNSTEEVETRFRLDRLSWRLGDSRSSSERLEVGRFLHSQMPQLGLVDGAEWVHRTQSGDRFGASVGLQPEWTAEMASGNDVESSLFYRHVGGDKGELSLGGAFQKTWHKGQADRDLALGDLSWRPSEQWWLYLSAWLDFYDSSDAPKSSGFELTELVGSATYRPDKSTGIGVMASQMRWPVLLKNELPPVSAATISDGSVARVGLNGWRDLTERVRLYGRLDRWSSDSDTGLGGELRASWRDLLFDDGTINAAVFANEGELTQVGGLRLSAWRSTASGGWSVGYEVANFEQQSGVGTATTLLQQVLRATWDMRLGEDWDLSLTADTRFGDEQDAQSIGFWLNRRF